MDANPAQRNAHITAPLLHTLRLRLRPVALTDFAACCALWTDPIVTQYLPPRTPEDVWSRILRYAGHWQLLGFGYWIVEELTTGTFVGELGLADYHREIDSPLAHLPDLGWVFTPSMHGKGYATEAANAALAWAFTNITTCDEVTCIVHPDNAASLRVAEKLGFRSRGDAMYRGHPIVILTLPIRA